MNNRIASPKRASAVLFAIGAFWIPCHVSAEPPHSDRLEFPVSLAVLDFSSSEKNGRVGAQLAALVSAELGSREGLLLVERASVDAIMSEGAFGLSGAVDTNSATKFGALIGAKVLVTGQVFPLADNSVAVAKVISSETGRVFATKIKFDGLDALDVAAERIAADIASIIAEHQGVLVPKRPDEEQWLHGLRKEIAGRKLPRVFVQIAEEHLSRPVPDPAAQTEVERIFHLLGGEVVSERGLAEVVITGEAFSENAGQFGGLVCCRARIETVMSKASAPGVKRVDRETVGGVDLSEHSAAKQALQKGGAILAGRLVLASISDEPVR